MVEDAELPRRPFGVAAIAVGEDELAARQLAGSRRPAPDPASARNSRCRGPSRGSRRGRCRAGSSARSASSRIRDRVPSAACAPPRAAASAAPTHRPSSSRRSARTGSNDADRACCRGRRPSRSHGRNARGRPRLSCVRSLLSVALPVDHATMAKSCVRSIFSDRRKRPFNATCQSAARPARRIRNSQVTLSSTPSEFRLHAALASRKFARPGCSS